MVRSISVSLLLAFCFVTSCGQTPVGKKLIDEINTAKVKARHLSDDGERKQDEAREKGEKGDKAQHDKLIKEAAKIYEQASDTLQKAAAKAKELAKLQSPPWYEEYFGLQARLLDNLANLAAGAHDELLARNSGTPSEAQVQLWKDQLKRIVEENEELRKQIASIELRQGVVLIKD